MANDFLRSHTVSATLTLVSTTTVNSTVTIPKGAVVTGISMFNNELLVGAGNVTVVVDTVAQMTAAAATLTDANVSRFTPNAAAKTIVSNNGGLIGVTTSTNTVGSVTVNVTYIL
jgi:hypothetical protein